MNKEIIWSVKGEKYLQDKMRAKESKKTGGSNFKDGVHKSAP